ncbi:MAG TPA: NAD(P)H-binding protein [Bacteroidales bacterium]|nr:NAD(P)H-binding protein [Bacteroidales bacterium]
MATIALFGASGKTGRILLSKLLLKGHTVKALVRNPAKLANIKESRLVVVEGDALDEDSVLMTLRNSDAVINVIGHVKGCPPDLQVQASVLIIKGMKKLGMMRLIDLTGSAVTVDGDNPGFFDKMVAFAMKNLLGKAVKHRFTDGENHVRIISKSKLDWTVVRAPVLLKGKAKGKTRTGLVGHIPGFSLMYEDLTDEIVKILEEKSYIRQYPYITNG